MKNKSRLQKSSKISKNARLMQWCIVDTENEFSFDGNTYLISNDVEEYRVYNKSGEVEDYTNEAYMDKILAVNYLDGVTLFYDQNYNIVNDVCKIIK